MDATVGVLSAGLAKLGKQRSDRSGATGAFLSFERFSVQLLAGLCRKWPLVFLTMEGKQLH